MHIMTIQTIPGCDRVVHKRLLRLAVMALIAELTHGHIQQRPRLPLMRIVTADTVSSGNRIMNIGLPCRHILMATGAELSIRCMQHRPVGTGMRVMARQAIPLRDRRMGTPAGNRRLLFMAEEAKRTPLRRQHARLFAGVGIMAGATPIRQRRVDNRLPGEKIVMAGKTELPSLPDQHLRQIRRMRVVTAVALTCGHRLVQNGPSLTRIVVTDQTEGRSGRRQQRLR